MVYLLKQKKKKGLLFLYQKLLHIQFLLPDLPKLKEKTIIYINNH